MSRNESTEHEMIVKVSVVDQLLLISIMSNNETRVFTALSNGTKSTKQKARVCD